MIRFLPLLLAWALALGGCAGVTPTIPASLAAVDARSAVEQVSAFRARHGLGGVRLDGRLMQAAERQALAMASRNRMSHSVSWGDTLPRRLSAAGYRWGAAAENIGAGYRTLEAAMAAWQASAGHRKNLLLEPVTEIGIAVAYAPDTRHGYFWALVLAAPPPERPAGAWGMPM